MDTSKQPVSAPSRQAVTRRLLGRARRYRGVIVAALLSSLIAGLTQAFPILLPKLFIDHVLSENGPREDLGFFDQWIVEQSGRLADALGQGAADGRLQVAWLVASPLLCGPVSPGARRLGACSAWRSPLRVACARVAAPLAVWHFALRRRRARPARRLACVAVA